MNTAPVRVHRLTFTHTTDAVHEFVLTTVLLFLTVTEVRWLRDPGSPFYIADLSRALAVIGVISGSMLIGLMLSPLGRRSGGHMNPAVTVALWLMTDFPGCRVVPYVFAQLAGSVAGAALGRLAWGQVVAHPQIATAAISPAPGWQPVSVFLAEAVFMALLMLVVGGFSGHARLIPYVIGISVALVIALLGPHSGGSLNPARQLGPALLSGHLGYLWIYLTAPILGAIVGAVLHRLLHTPRVSSLRAAFLMLVPAGPHLHRG